MESFTEGYLANFDQDKLVQTHGQATFSMDCLTTSMELQTNHLLQIKGSPSTSGTRRNWDGMADAGKGWWGS